MEKAEREKKNFVLGEEKKLYACVGVVIKNVFVSADMRTNMLKGKKHKKSVMAGWQPQKQTIVNK